MLPFCALQWLNLPKPVTCVIIYNTILFVVNITFKITKHARTSLFTLQIARIPLHRKIAYRKVGVFSDKSNMFTFEFIENCQTIFLKNSRC